MELALGVDTGGTYTDAVLVMQDTGRVVVSAKALTTRHDLALGIGEAIRAVCAAAAGRGIEDVTAAVTLVGLSTTLATNTLAEGQRSAVCLLLIGYDPELMRAYGFERELATDDIVYIKGGHDPLGNESAPLDEDGARAAILARRDTVEAFAISGYFSVRNPAHELRVKALVKELTGLPATCGHELTSQFNAVRRATTVALNAHLIAPLRELIASVQAVLMELGITAPLMVVKGDGSLVRAEWALERPVETILSGPAASALGAWHLAGRRDAWTVDVGGTTTDIAVLRGGWPILNREGAQVAGWRTMVEAVDVHTAGLGGDSYVRFDDEGRLVIGPQRAVPVSLLARQFPDILDELQRQHQFPLDRLRDGIAEFVVLGRHTRVGLSPADRELLDQLADGPVSVEQLVGRARTGGLTRRRLADLAGRGLVRRAAFTPSDALHVLGRFCAWDAEAARLAASLLARVAGMAPAAFCEMVVERFSQRIATELVSKVLEDELGRPDWQREPTAAALLQRALDAGVCPGPHLTRQAADEIPQQAAASTLVGRPGLPGSSAPQSDGEMPQQAAASTVVVTAASTSVGRPGLPGNPVPQSDGDIPQQAAASTAASTAGFTAASTLVGRPGLPGNSVPQTHGDIPQSHGEAARQAADEIPQQAATSGAGSTAASDLVCTFTLRRPIVAVGAPVAAYLPRVAAALHTELVIPPHAEVANAVGAVSGSIVQRVQAFITPLDEEGRVRLHLPDGVRDFATVRAAVEHAEQVLPSLVESLARQAGAEQVEVRATRADHTAPVKGAPHQAIYLGSELTFVAAGRPSPARR